jgi:hypothetical protein
MCDECQLGLCGGGVLSDCDCSNTQISKYYVDITSGTAKTIYNVSIPLMNVTDIKVQRGGSAVYVLINMTRINQLPDSVSSVCGDSADGYTKCNLTRSPVIFDSKNSELNLTTSSIFSLNTVTGILTVRTSSYANLG